MSPDQPSTRSLPSYAHPTVDRDAGFGIGLLVLAVAQASVRYFRLLVDDAELHPDAALVWRPLATAVIDGTPLYVGAATDNKPPVFEFVNLLVALTDAYTFTFLLLVALANGVSAILLYRLFAREGLWRIGAVAAAGFLLAVPLVKGHAINVRSFAVCATFLALTVSRPVLCGALAATGVLFSQYLVFGVPVVCWWHLSDPRRKRETRAWLLRFATAGFVIGLLAYGAVLALWGWESFLGSLHWSVGSARRYFTAYGPSVWVGQRAWVVYTTRLVSRLWPLLLSATVGAGVVLHRRVAGGEQSRRFDRGHRLGHLTVVAATVFGGLLLVRPYETYWLYVLPWVAALGAIGLGARWDAGCPTR